MVNRRQLLKISALGTASFAAPLAYSASNITMAYNTGNAIGSTSPKDLSDNARNLDHLVNGPDASYLDRKGVPRKSWKGMEGEHNADQVRREAEFDADQWRRESEFDADQNRRESEFDIAQGDRVVQFNTLMEASGYEPPIPYTPGIVLDRTTKTVSYLGNEYRAKGSFIPMTTSSWAVDEDKLKLIGDDSLRQNLADPSVGTTLITLPLAYPGAETISLEQYIGAGVNARAFGVFPRPNYDNRIPLQMAIAHARLLGVPVDIPGAQNDYLLGLTVWASSDTFLRGCGGKNKKTKFAAMDGHFTDLICSGEHTEGINHAEVGQELIYRNGFPYTADLIGRNIRLQGIYINGNGDNAGYAPEIGPATQYRGCNVRIRYVDGVFVDDLFSQYAPNDCLYISRCRRVWAQNSIVADNRLPGFTGIQANSTRNLMTCAGTLAWRPEFGDLSDFFILDNIQGFNSEDVGICVQFIQEPGTTVTSGPLFMRGLTTKNCAAYGSSIEVSGSGVNQNPRDCITIDGITSIGDSWLLPLASVLISQRSINVNIGSVIIKDACHRGLLCAGSQVLNIAQIIVDGWGKNPRIASIYVPAVHIYADGGVDIGERVNIAQVDIRNPGVGDCTGLEVSGFDICKVDSVHVEETRYASKADGAAIQLSCNRNYGDKLTTNKAAGNGIRVTGFTDMGLTNSHARNSGQASGAQKVGINIQAGTNRRGRVIGCSANDDQAIPTQDTGILLGVSATDVILVTGCDAVGNISHPLNNLGMPNAKVHANLFEYSGQTSEFILGGNGGFQSAIKMGLFYVWVESSTTKLRIKASKPTSNSDGIVVGTQT